ncbi:S-methyl-5-thioribose-1-phosphate isomerase [Synchytrium endobioticum]|uniref:S-methyl-5-thioribose-1-phosphate isomerase n=1 Tax=Synchytrium endobioticum TaxID=286115 RepID=A0A507D6Z6_9FUNG|nr:S-methyl-5-thioribose-1-phosphate isomerase [Synchytrium endobioticum]TPX47772.1 S-methyl-5-thioribose-1-phosphate isomerase [Synchytrium endobioticum]
MPTPQVTMQENGLPGLKAIKYRRGSLEILNQLLLPWESVYEEVRGVDDGHAAIKTMKIRGAPAIAIVAALSLAVELHIQANHAAHSELLTSTPSQVVEYILSKLEYLTTSRPTAVNLFDAAKKLGDLVTRRLATLKQESNGATENASNTTKGCHTIIEAYIQAAEDMLRQDLTDNKSIGRFGADFISSLYPPDAVINLVTHCNTGSLATSGWGTALGIIREMKQPYELVYEHIPATLVTDNMVGELLKRGGISAVVVGADRVTANGDTANKIGTYQLALLAHYHNVPFIVAAPSSSIDVSLAHGDYIDIEMRPQIEVVQIRGQVVEDVAGDLKEPFEEGIIPRPQSVTIGIAAPGIAVWNPAFDVTPAKFISAIVTEVGVVTREFGSDVYDLKSFLSGKGVLKE